MNAIVMIHTSGNMPICDEFDAALSNAAIAAVAGESCTDAMSLRTAFITSASHVRNTVDLNNVCVCLWECKRSEALISNT